MALNSEARSAIPPPSASLSSTGRELAQTGVERQVSRLSGKLSAERTTFFRPTRSSLMNTCAEI